MIPYNNAMYPPGYNIFTIYKTFKWKLNKYIRHYIETQQSYSRERVEREIWESVKFYMGRTEWDKALANIMHPNCYYYHVDEALRTDFINSAEQWEYKKNKKISLLTIAHSGTWYWKGIDMLLKTANILKNRGVDFEWKLAGGISETMKNTIEKNEKTTFAENNVQLFITSHNIDSVKGLMEAYTEHSEEQPNLSVFKLIKKTDDTIVPLPYDYANIKYMIQQEIEMR